MLFASVDTCLNNASSFAIASSDGVIMISPEYNHGMSGVLKNALDWASRPHGRSTLMRKPVLTMTASPAFTGGVRAQQQMNETLVSIPGRAVLRPQPLEADERRPADRAEDAGAQRTAASPSSAFASAKKSGTGCTR